MSISMKKLVGWKENKRNERKFGFELDLDLIDCFIKSPLFLRYHLKSGKTSQGH